MTTQPLPSVRFDAAWKQALAHAGQAAQRFGMNVVVTRDLLGRASLLVDDRADPLAADAPDVVSTRDGFAAATHPFTGLEPLVLGSLLFAPDLFFASGDRTEVSASHGNVGSVHALERTVIGADWTSAPLPARTPSDGDWDRRDRRVAMYGFKGVWAARRPPRCSPGIWPTADGAYSWSTSTWSRPGCQISWRVRAASLVTASWTT